MLMPLFPASSRPIRGPLSRRRQAKSSHAESTSRSSFYNRLIKCSVGVSVLICLAVNVFMVMGVFGNKRKKNSSVNSRNDGSSMMRIQQQHDHPGCRLREYPSHRYSDWSRQLAGTANHPSFLTEPEYIYGEWPRILQLDDSDASHPRKLCVDQSTWLKSSSTATTTLPFADGTNPSIVSMRRLDKFAPSVAMSFLKKTPNAAYIATACMTNSQCTWPEAAPPDNKPVVVLTVIIILDASFASLDQTTITLERDAAWGKQPQPPPANGNGNLHATPALDDARLFVHDEQLWISYREGPVFGYESQVLNPVHVATDGDHSLQVWIKASETTSFCCGRNMALMQDVEAVGLAASTPLRALTWVDPVTVETVDTTPLIQRPKKTNKKKNRRRRDLKQEQSTMVLGSLHLPTMFHNGTISEQLRPQLIPTEEHRRLASTSTKKKKSHIHGTNAFMVHLVDRHEYFGVGHFHRPPDRAPNSYARFGHHYTHCFFTISDQPPYVLTNLSPEFLLPAATGIHGKGDAEVIQFLSGLEVIEGGDTSNSNKDRSVIIAYGINDCEAVITNMPWSAVESLMRPISPHQQGDAAAQVVDFMMPLQSS